MDLDAAASILSDLAPSSEEWNSEVGVRGRTPNRDAYMKLTSKENTVESVVVSTVGDPWFMLEVPGGFAHLHISEGLSKSEVRQVLEEYVEAGCDYLNGQWSIGKSRWTRVPVLTVYTRRGPMRLQLSVRGQLKHMLLRKRS